MRIEKDTMTQKTSQLSLSSIEKETRIKVECGEELNDKREIEFNFSSEEKDE
jgi:hypothetical protein